VVTIPITETLRKLIMGDTNLRGGIDELTAERERMQQLLADVATGRRAVAEIPTDAYTYYGRIETLDRAIRAHQAGCLIEELTGYAQFGENLNLQGCAETVIARRFSQQLRTGCADVDLTQHYATDDPRIASERHDIALARLSKFISTAEEFGYRVHRGEAIAAAMKHAQGLAIASGIGA
jgi:hypothetical protein